MSGWPPSGSPQDRPDGIEDEVEPKLELVGVVEAGREQLTADTREVRVRIRRHLGDHSDSSSALLNCMFTSWSANPRT